MDKKLPTNCLLIFKSKPYNLKKIIKEHKKEEVIKNKDLKGNLRKTNKVKCNKLNKDKRKIKNNQDNKEIQEDKQNRSNPDNKDKKSKNK